MSYKYPDDPNDWNAIIAWKKKMQSRDWDDYIKKGKVKEMLLGNTHEFFKPDDGKSQGSIEHYRWFHNRSVMIGRILCYFIKDEEYDELNSIFFTALKSLNNDSLVVLDCISKLTGCIYHKSLLCDEVSYRRVYLALNVNIKKTYQIIDSLQKADFNLPEDYPGKVEKVKSNIEKKISMLDKLYQ